MNLTKPQVQHIAELAKLDLQKAEIEKFRQQLSSILEYVELLNEVDTSNIEPTAQTTGLKNVFREDKPSKKEVLTQGEVLANAPEKQEGFIKTKAVL
jgi:aspartyl-tRNA(Asn)/glutamyl-tRNA(Gln) amidotransferase subunit C